MNPLNLVLWLVAGLALVGTVQAVARQGDFHFIPSRGRLMRGGPDRVDRVARRAQRLKQLNNLV